MRSAPHRALGPAAVLAVAVLALSACDSGRALTAPDPDPPSPPPPPAPPVPPPTVEGLAIYAVDLSNRLLLFGSESPETIARSTRITGVTPFSRIVEIDYRPSTGELYGVGNDSRVYIIDPGTAAATPVSEEPFSPPIAALFDIHFGMSFDPVTERIRLISGDFGVNWSIDPDDGTAVRGPDVRVVTGDPNEGATLHLAGLTAVPPAAAARVSAPGAPAQCRVFDALFVAIDPDLGSLFSTCDPDASDWETLGEVPFARILRCIQIKFTFEGTEPKVLASVVEDGKQRLYEVDPFTFDLSPLGELSVDSPIQGFAFPPSGDGSLLAAAQDRARPGPVSRSSERPQSSIDLGARCTGGS